jgi:hypothetical protein
MQRKLVLFAAVLILTSCSTKNSNVVKVKNTPEQQALLKLAKEVKDEQELIRPVAEKIQKELNDQNAPINAVIITKTPDEQAQLQKNNNAASAKYLAATGAVQTKLQQDAPKVQALVEIVKIDQKLPDDAQFDLNSLTWIRVSKAK